MRMVFFDFHVGCPLLALSGHGVLHRTCLLLGQSGHWVCIAATFLMPVSTPIKVLALADTVLAPELGGGHAAARVRHAHRRCGGDLAVCSAGAAADEVLMLRTTAAIILAFSVPGFAFAQSSSVLSGK